MNIAGIDPGHKGAIALQVDGSTIVRAMPMTGGALDLPEIARVLGEPCLAMAIIEKAQAMPKQGVTSMFTYGVGFGALLGILAALGVRVELVPPGTWKKSVLAGTDRDKDAAIAYCRRAFPSISLLETPRCTKPHDGMADALCILEYGRRTYAGGQT